MSAAIAEGSREFFPEMRMIDDQLPKSGLRQPLDQMND